MAAVDSPDAFEIGEAGEEKVGDDWFFGVFVCGVGRPFLPFPYLP